MIFTDMLGTKVPSLGFGTFRLKGTNCLHAVNRAIGIGYRHIDTAQFYENEADVGQAIASSGIPREEFFITTKVWVTNLAAKNVISSTEKSLQKLKMDYVNLLLVHWPNAEVPLKETLAAMMKIKESGKTKLIGVSNFPVKLLKEATEKLGFPIACNQIEYHALLSQKPVTDYAHSHKMAITAYCPLAQGKLRDNQILIGIGNKYSKTPTQVALRWLIEQPNVAAIPKAESEEHAKENFSIFDFKLSDEDKKAISKLNGNTRLVNPSIAPDWD